jgi:hypothetical protein
MSGLASVDSSVVIQSRNDITNKHYFTDLDQSTQKLLTNNIRDKTESRRIYKNRASLDQIAEKSILDLDRILTKYEDNIVYKKSLYHQDIAE